MLASAPETSNLSDTKETPEELLALPRWWPAMRWFLLAQAVSNILTNAYYLQLFEPAISRKTLLLVSVALGGAAFWTDRVGLRVGWRPMWAFARRHSVWIVLVMILGVAFGLRLWGITYGLPQSFISDEYDYVHSYLQMIKRGDFNPRWWIHPSMQAYVNVGVYLIVFVAQVSSGRWHSVQELAVEDFLYWGRFGAGVVPGTLAVLATFFLGRRMFGSGVGLMAAALMAVFPGAVEWSQYNKPDPLLALMAPFSILLILYYMDYGGKTLAFLCGIAFGLTAAAKYNGGFVVLTFLLAVILTHRSRFLKAPDLYLGATGSVAGFFIGCPYWFSDFARFIDHVADALYNYGHAGWPGASGVDNWYFHAHYAVVYGTGALAFFAALVGLAFLLTRLDNRMIVFLSFPVLYYGYYSSQLMNFPGNLMCVYPFIAVFAVVGIQVAASALTRLPTGKAVSALMRPVGVAVLLTLSLWAPLSATVRHNVEWNRPNTGDMARLWVDAHIPPNTHFAIERQTAAIDPKRFRVTIEARLITRAVANYRSEGVQYLVTSSALYARFGPEHRQTKAYEKLFAICPLVKEFTAVDGRSIGPTIRILQVPAES